MEIKAEKKYRPQELADRCLREYQKKEPDEGYWACTPVKDKPNHFALLGNSNRLKEVRWEPDYQMFTTVSSTGPTSLGSLTSISSTPPKPKGKIFGALATILTVVYSIYIVSYFGSAGMEDLGGALAAMLVTPHMVCVVVAAAFSLVGLFATKRWAILVAGILMAVAAALFPAYASLVIVQSILFFISYARMKV